MSYFGPNDYTSPVPDNLWAGTQIQPVVADEVILKMDATLKLIKRGTVLGKITATGLCVPVDKAATDGSEKVHTILAEDRDVETANAPAPGYLSGEFSETGVIFVKDTLADHRLSARENGIFFKSVVSA